MEGKQHEPDRYARYWSWVAKQTRHQQGGICCFSGCDRAIWQVHHAVYLELNDWGELVPVKGREQPGIHCFGLCRKHHGNARTPHSNHKDAAHYVQNWLRGIKPPDHLDARNTVEYYRLLVQGFREKTCGSVKTCDSLQLKT